MTVQELAKSYCDNWNDCSVCPFQNEDQYCPILLIGSDTRNVPVSSDIDSLVRAANILKEYEEKCYPTYREYVLSVFPNIRRDNETNVPFLCPGELFSDICSECPPNTTCKDCWDRRMERSLK